MRHCTDPAGLINMIDTADTERESLTDRKTDRERGERAVYLLTV